MADEIQEERPKGKGLREGVGKLFLVLAGGLALAVLIFVVLPMLTPTEKPAEAPQAMAPRDIVGEVLGRQPETSGNGPAAQDAEPAEADTAALQDTPGEGVAQAPSPLVAVRDNGETMPVVFPRPEPEEEVGTPAAGPDAELPPPLSPEEIEAALPEPAGTPDSAGEAGPPAQAEPPASAAPKSVQPGAEGPPPQAPLPGGIERPAGATAAEVREVQGLLEELGYDPGPVDGVWGRRTTAAWKAFASEAGGLALALAAVEELSEGPPSAQELEGVQELEARWDAGQAPAPVESRAPVEAALPSEEPPHVPVSGAARAGNPPPGPPAHAAVTTGALRGVMGYRLPLVSRQEVPDQVASGVLIPAHTTFVILRPGFWELTGLSPDDVQLLRDAQARAEAEALAARKQPEPARRSWNPLRLFRRQGTGGMHE